MDERQFAAAALGFAGAVLAIPIALAKLDFGQLVNVFNIDSSDSPSALVVLAAISGIATLGVAVAAIVGAILALVAPRTAGRVLAGAALSGIVTAQIFWAPGTLLGLATLAARRASGGPLVGSAEPA